MDGDDANTLMHEFQRCRNAFKTYTELHQLIISGCLDRNTAISCYNAYTDFVAHLYEFYCGCIKRNSAKEKDIKGQKVDRIINAEVEKLLKNRRDSILRGEAPDYENNFSHYQIGVPREFGSMLREVRNLRNHALAKRSAFDLSLFYRNYHRFVWLLYESPQWLWNSEKFPDHDWREIEKFAKQIAANGK